ncbi:pygopus homolog 1-like [Portunus trituberculatus]|uniref:pygopus homolog 1-like n=1 Tax=Portunus trituberculatus TaxID=210409 RepID=UPI001E1D13CC|nr:pygopus homolog 1-like [Portunus trituberculatus]
MASTRRPLHPCSGCGKEVRPQQQAILCDSCHQWRHRLCVTNITQAMYRQINKELKQGGSFDWTCPSALPTTHQSAQALVLAVLRPAIQQKNCLMSA